MSPLSAYHSKRENKRPFEGKSAEKKNREDGSRNPEAAIQITILDFGELLYTNNQVVIKNHKKWTKLLFVLGRSLCKCSWMKMNV